MRVWTHIVVPEGLELLGAEVIEEKERPYGLPFSGGKKAANLGLAHFPHSRLQYQDVSHFYLRRRRHCHPGSALPREDGVDLRDRRRPLANGAAHALDRPGAHVPDRENARHAGFQRQPRVLAGGYESLVVDRDVAVLQPFGGGIRAEEHEDVADWASFFLIRVELPSGHGFDAGLGLTAQPADLRARAPRGG